jgi:hypothetical protein
MPAAITNHHKTPQSMEKETVRLPSSSTTKITVLSTTKKEQIQDEEDAECGAQNLENSPSVKLPLDGQCGMLAGQKFVYDCIPSNYRQLFRNLPPQSLSSTPVQNIFNSIKSFL